MFRKKIWQDRQVEHPNRRRIKDTSTGDMISAEITRDEGNVLTKGDMINADTMNDLERRIEAGINSGGGSGSLVEVIPTLDTGTKIADIVVDGVNNELYAPDGGGGTPIDIEVNPSDEATSGMKKLRVDGTTYNISTADLADVSDIPPYQGQMLFWENDGSCWIPGNMSISSLVDESTSGYGHIAVFNYETSHWEANEYINPLEDKQVFMWNDSEKTWENHTLALHDIADFDPTYQSLHGGDLIYYNSSDAQWAPTAFSGLSAGDILIWDDDAGTWTHTELTMNTLSDVSTTAYDSIDQSLEFLVRGNSDDEQTWRNSTFTIYGLDCENSDSMGPTGVSVSANTETMILQADYVPAYYWHMASISSHFNLDLSFEVDPSQVPAGGEYRNISCTFDFYLTYQDSELGEQTILVASECPASIPVFISDTYHQGSNYTIPYKTSFHFEHMVSSPGSLDVSEDSNTYTWYVNITSNTACKLYNVHSIIHNITQGDFQSS